MAFHPWHKSGHGPNENLDVQPGVLDANGIPTAYTISAGGQQLAAIKFQSQPPVPGAPPDGVTFESLVAVAADYLEEFVAKFPSREHAQAKEYLIAALLHAHKLTERLNLPKSVGGEAAGAGTIVAPTIRIDTTPAGIATLPPAVEPPVAVAVAVAPATVQPSAVGQPAPSVPTPPAALTVVEPVVTAMPSTDPAAAPVVQTPPAQG